MVETAQRPEVNLAVEDVSDRPGSPRRPRVLLVLVEVRADAGGIENVGCSLVRLLSEKHRARVLDFRVASLRGPETDTDRRNVEQWAGSRLTHFDGRRGAFSLSVLWQMIAWADVAIFIHIGVSSLQAVLPRWLKPTSITWIHGVEAWSRPTRRRRLGLARSDYLVANTAFTMQKALAANPWLREPRVCHLGIPDDDVPATTDSALPPGFSPGRHDILIVGRMAKGEGQKGHQQLISAMGDVRRVVPDARLIVAGTGDDVAFYQALAHETAVSGSVIFTGHVNDAVLAALYRRCGIFAMPSRQEGFGLVYLEAMRAGLPCISSVWDGGQEIVLDGETGYHVDPDDRQALTATLTRLLLDDELRSCLGSRGRARFHESFTERHFHDRFWEALSAALAR